jgi:hypothetical protein
VSKQQAESFAYFIYSLSLKMEAVLSSEIKVNFHKTTWHNVPENSIFHSQHIEDLKSQYDHVVLQVKYSGLNVIYLFLSNFLCHKLLLRMLFFLIM